MRIIVGVLIILCVIQITGCAGIGGLAPSGVRDYGCEPKCDSGDFYIPGKGHWAPQKRMLKADYGAIGGSAIGAALATSSQNAAFIITLKESRFEKSVLSVSATTGKVEEYQIVFQAKIDVMHADGTYIVENEKISAIRDFAFDENAVLGEFEEESIIQEDLIRRAASQVLRRLQALLSSSK